MFINRASFVTCHKEQRAVNKEGGYLKGLWVELKNKEKQKSRIAKLKTAKLKIAKLKIAELKNSKIEEKQKSRKQN